jgi:TolB-like protein/tetratricopeptide (TPR) repeat protein
LDRTGKIWSAEIVELETLQKSVSGRFPELGKDLEHLIKTDDENVALLYSRRCLEIIVTDLCESELKRPSKTEPLKGIIDKLNREEKVPSHIITSMQSLNSMSTYGAHPKEFDPRQVKPVLNNLTTIIEWYLKYKNIESDKTVQEKEGMPHIDTGDKEYLVSASFSKPEKSIIVLPFVNISPDPDQEYFSDGLTEEIITDLSHIHDLLVISRNSAMTFKGTKKKTGEIAGEVNVRYVLEGSVRKAGNNLRITAQLIDAITDTHLWAEKYSGILDDVFDIQERVSHSIVDSLKVKLSPEERKKIIDHPIPNAKAYEYYLKARQDIVLASEEALPRAIQNIQKAMDIVGENALLYFGLGYAYFGYENVGTKPDEFYLTKAEEYARKVFELEPESYHGYLLQGLIQMKRGKFQEVVRHLKKALFIEQNDLDVLFWLSLTYLEVGKTSAAAPLINRLLQLDPFTPIYQLLPGWLHLMDGQLEVALEPCRKGFNINPGDFSVRYYYALVLAFNNHISEALSLIDVMIRELPDLTYSRLGKITRYALLEDKEMVQKSLTQELINFARRDEQGSWIIAGCLSLVDEKREALDWLENAVKEGCTNYPFLNEYYPFLENIRAEMRFKKLMEKVKYEWENFEV